jgi:hypothetical protein
METKTEVCSNHPDEPQLGYLQAYADAQERLKHREEQWHCGLCNRWVWSEFFVAFKGGVYREKWWNQKLEKERVNGRNSETAKAARKIADKEAGR